MRTRFGGSRDLEQQIERLRQLFASIDINALPPPPPPPEQIQEVYQHPEEEEDEEEPEPEIYYTLLGNRENFYRPLFPKNPHDDEFESEDELSRYMLIMYNHADPIQNNNFRYRATITEETKLAVQFFFQSKS